MTIESHSCKMWLYNSYRHATFDIQGLLNLSRTRKTNNKSSEMAQKPCFCASNTCPTGTHSRYVHDTVSYTLPWVGHDPTFWHVGDDIVHLLTRLSHKKTSKKRENDIVSCSDNAISHKLTILILFPLSTIRRWLGLPSLEARGWRRRTAGERERSPEFPWIWATWGMMWGRRWWWHRWKVM